MKKSKLQLLEEFTKILFEHDPMGLTKMGMPDAETEYDGEALSILARFVEGHVASMPKESADQFALRVVQEAFTFWFRSTLLEERAGRLADALLGAIVAACPEQEEDPKVGSEQ